jgi:hypothetical protein
MFRYRPIEGQFEVGRTTRFDENLAKNDVVFVVAGVTSETTL